MSPDDVSIPLKTVIEQVHDKKDLISHSPTILEEHKALKSENEQLKSELDATRCENVSIRAELRAMHRRLDRVEGLSELVNLCKLLLTGSAVPFVSIFLLYCLLDGARW